MTLRNLQGVSVDELVQEYEQATVACGQALAVANHRAANQARSSFREPHQPVRLVTRRSAHSGC
jgi:ribosomal protein L12E/L44/L45/RPP1/RPP2